MGTVQTHIRNTASDGLAPSTFGVSLEYSTDKVVLFWQPPSYFRSGLLCRLSWTTLSYSCPEQYMMTEKARLFRDHRAVEPIMSSPEPSTHKRVGRGVRNIDFAVWDREKQSAVFSGIYPNITRNPAMKL